MPEFLRILMRKTAPTSMIDIDREIFVLIGNFWCVFHASGVMGGIAKPNKPILNIAYGKHDRSAIALLISRKVGLLTGTSLFIGLPFKRRVRISLERYLDTKTRSNKIYGLLYSQDAEGFYWGEKEFMYGDPSLDQLLWDDCHGQHSKDSKDV